MKSSDRNLSLTSYDDLFATDASRADADREKVMEIPLSELFLFKDHPFKVRDDDKMADTAESIREYGVLVPALARPREGGGYELISGHRRKRGCELAGLDTMPVIVRDMDDDDAVIVMVDSKKIALNPAVELSYLTPAEQEMLVVTMDSEQATPSLSQAQRLKRFSQDGKLTEESMLAICTNHVHVHDEFVYIARACSDEQHHQRFSYYGIL